MLLILGHLCAGADTLLGPEMRSTGEVMGIDKTYAKAYAKAAIAAGQKLPATGNVFVTVMDKDKDAVIPIAKKLKVSLFTCNSHEDLKLLGPESNRCNQHWLSP